MGRRDKTSANVAPDAKRVARDKSEYTPLTDAQPPSRLPHFALAVVLAAALFAYRRLGASTQPLASVPASYALCADSQKIYTVNPALPVVDCFLVHRDTITATGTLEEVKAHWDVYQTELVDQFYGGEPKAKKPLTVLRAPPGSIVVPGLADAHAHLIEYGAKMELPLDTADSLDAVLDTLEAHIRTHPELIDDPDAWVTGMGWDQSRWRGWRGGLPHAADLATRPLLAARPLALSRVDGHALWLSPRALERSREAAGGPLPDVSGGEVVRDGSGVLLDEAMALVPIPPRTDAQRMAYAQRAVSDALAVGLTSVHDAMAGPAEVQTFERMAEEGTLPIRVYAMRTVDTPDALLGPRLEDYGTAGRLNVRSVKLFTDGMWCALGSWGAALLAPYSDNQNTSGIMRIGENELYALIQRVWDEGWGVNVHCIGDRANKAALDAFEKIIGDDVELAARRRPRIEHAQIMRKEDIVRAGKLGVIASVQPTHATSDMWYAEDRLGPERIKGAYAYQSLLQASNSKVLPLGSDFPVEGINPLLGFHAAVSRLDVRGSSPHGDSGWFPSERLTRAQALKGMTLDAAYAAFAEHERGSLEPGKKADYVVLNTDIMREDAPFGEILQTRVLATVVDGQIAYGAI
ncbi:hypothetical protein CERSUDRAFT_97001 [Gelatoporia subvermispora B]|uniref:Amidohydrolase 3 domain-containing protein n=1 Tax=Ceriporiopsis subvermispora (strain B) TaxID=914234 RepID=M2PGF9_CERS8|nr:hypothetical protein CERSUDRAFT_97001 [Gelatoporia subvermispora B]